jgi:hypothetical protein
MGWIASTRAVTVWSTLAMLAFIERALFDFRYVFPEELPDDPLSVAGATAVYLLFVAAWTWGLLAAQGGSRAALRMLIVLPLITLVGLGLGTLTAFCPSPCETAWPFGELSNWAGLVLGLVAVVSAALALLRPAGEA